MTRVLVADVGWCVAKMEITEGTSVSLMIVSPADTDAGRYAPAESVCVYGRGNLVKLQQFLNDNLNAKEQP